MIRSGKGPIKLAARLAPIVLLLLGLTSPRSRADGPASKPDDEAKKVEATAKLKDAALKSAEKFLVLVDKGKYSESWDASCEWFRKGITRRKWIDTMIAARRPLGEIRSRKLNRIEMRASENPKRIDQAWIYSDIQFVSGEGQAELVIVFFERSKDWRHSGYFMGSEETLPKPPAEKKDEPKPAEK